MTLLARWWLAIRPKTLSIAVTPVLVGVSLAWTEQRLFASGTALLSLATALLIQIGTNLYNDVADFERGSDTPRRLGPPRATAQGWLTPRQVKWAAFGSFAAALLMGIPLTLIGGWPILVIGLLSLAAGYAYTGGPHPIAYSRTGELFVFLFFGVIAVTGSYYLQTHTLSPVAVLAGCAVGLLAAAVLLVNNFRDLDQDRRAGKLTLCHQIGRSGSRRFYAGLLLLPFALALFPAMQHPWRALFLLALPGALLLIRRLATAPAGPGLNRVLAATAGLELAFGVLLSTGFLLAP